jgi:phosphoesterase RecJ-like protein
MDDSRIRTPEVPDEVIRFLTNYDTYYFFGHVEPDGDCIASALALGGYLERVFGKRVRYFAEGPFLRREIAHFQDSFQDRVPEEARRADPRPAAVIIDCSGPDRIGGLEADLSDLPVAVIDHHATAKPFGDARFVETTAAASCYLVQLVLERLGEPITAEEAQLLLFGIMTDTGYMRHVESDAAPLFAAVSRLLAAGASPKLAHRQMFGGQTLESRKLLGALIGRMRTIAGGAGIITWETQSDIDTFGKEARDSDTLYQLLFGIEGVRTAAVIRHEDGGKVSGSLRSIDSIDVSRIASSLGGGGHKRAAGFAMEGELEVVVDRVQAMLEAAVQAES